MKALLGAVFAAALLLWSAPSEAFRLQWVRGLRASLPDNITFEGTGTPKTVEGDILVAAIPGGVKIGTGWTFKGAIFADTIIIAQGSTVAKCVANHIVGNGCLQSLTPYVPFPGCTLQPFPPGIVVPQFPANPADCLPGTAIIVSAPTALPSGCYASIRVLKDQVLTLEAGASTSCEANSGP